jgi:predicted nucleotidyltransferase
MVSPEFICQELGIDYSQVLNIYPYGSKIYGTDNENSDDDYVIVYKTSFLPNGCFRDNARSSKNRKIQGTCYSKSGFIDAINNYQISALECIFLPEDKVIQKKMNFQMSRFYKKDLARKIITTASSSWHFANLAHKDNHYESCAKNIFHALRILDFGIQIKEHHKIVNYSSMNKIKESIYDCPPNPWDYYETFLALSDKIRR